jgi:hypothetical protein
LLDCSTWDLVLDASGNIAVASAPYGLAQDAASAIRLFAGGLWYNTAQGVPYFGEILGQASPIAVMKAAFVNAALIVPGVGSAVCYTAEIKGRIVTGQVQVTDLSVRQPWSIPRGMNIQSPSFASLVTSPSRTMRHPRR